MREIKSQRAIPEELGGKRARAAARHRVPHRPVLFRFTPTAMLPALTSIL